jgi:hypothetical protein
MDAIHPEALGLPNFGADPGFPGCTQIEVHPAVSGHLSGLANVKPQISKEDCLNTPARCTPGQHLTAGWLLADSEDDHRFGHHGR